MSKSKIVFTPTTNIKNNAVVDNDLVRVETYDSYMDIFLMVNKNGDKRKSNLMGVSVYDDLIIIDDVKYTILRMLTS